MNSNEFVSNIDKKEQESNNTGNEKTPQELEAKRISDQIKVQDISVEVWKQNYQAPNEQSYYDTWIRQAKAASEIEDKSIQEKVYNDFLWLLSDFKGIAGGRITANLGVARKGTTLMNCVAGETLVLTKYGKARAKELVGKTIDVFCIDHEWRPATWNSYGTQELYKVEFEDGTNIYATEKHEWFVNDGDKTVKKTTVNLKGCLIPNVVYAETVKVVNVSKTDKVEEVYCCQEPITHSWTLYGGIITGNCFVHNPADIDYKDPDSIEGIYTLLKSQALTLKSEGGYGMNFSWCRPAGTYINGIGSFSPGIINFMSLWDKSSEIITMGSEVTFGETKKEAKKKIRKGAQMGILSCVSGNSLISTLDGIYPIKDLVGKKPNVYCTDGNGNTYVRKANKVWSNGVKKVVKIKFDNDDSIICTPEHKIMLSDGTYKEASKLDFTDSVSVLDKINYKIVSVEDFGELEVFDISVPDYHNFVVNNVFVHNCWHPEVENFIDAKLTPNRLTKFNLSIGITDGFMDAVINDEKWNLEFPDVTHDKYKTEWFGDIYKWKSKGYPVNVYKTMKARDLWDKIMKATYTRNDPGVLFLDLANKLNPLVYGEDVYTTNPCLTGDTKVTTDKGVMTLIDVDAALTNGVSLKVLSYDIENNVTEFQDITDSGVTRINAEVIEIELESGEIIKATPDHPFYTTNRGYVNAKDILETDELVLE